MLNASHLQSFFVLCNFSDSFVVQVDEWFEVCPIHKTSTSKTFQQKCGKCSGDRDGAGWPSIKRKPADVVTSAEKTYRNADKSVCAELVGAGLGGQVSGGWGACSLQLWVSTSEWQFDEGGVAWGKLDCSPLALLCSLIISKDSCSQAVRIGLPKKKTSSFLLAHSLPLSGPQQNPTCQITDAQASAAHRPRIKALSHKNTQGDSDGSRKGENSFAPSWNTEKGIWRKAAWGHCSDFAHWPAELNAVSGNKNVPQIQPVKWFRRFTCEERVAMMSVRNTTEPVTYTLIRNCTHLVLIDQACCVTGWTTLHPALRGKQLNLSHALPLSLVTFFTCKDEEPEFNVAHKTVSVFIFEVKSSLGPKPTKPACSKTKQSKWWNT